MNSVFQILSAEIVSCNDFITFENGLEALFLVGLFSNNIDLPIFATFFSIYLWQWSFNGHSMTAQISFGSKLNFDLLLFGILTLALKMRLWKGNFDTKNFLFL